MYTGGLSIQCENRNHRHVVLLAGELDLAGINRVKEEIEHAEVQLQQTDDVEEIVVDTTELTFIDSSGLGTLIAAHERLGDTMALIPGRQLERLLNLTGTRSVFQTE